MAKLGKKYSQRQGYACGSTSTALVGLLSCSQSPRSVSRGSPSVFLSPTLSLRQSTSPLRPRNSEGNDSEFFQLCLHRRIFPDFKSDSTVSMERLIQPKLRTESHSTRVPVLNPSPSQACLLPQAISSFTGRYRLSQSHGQSNAYRILLRYDRNSRHRRIKKQRRYERLAATSQFVDDPSEPKATCDIQATYQYWGEDHDNAGSGPGHRFKLRLNVHCPGSASSAVRLVRIDLY